MSNVSADISKKSAPSPSNRLTAGGIPSAALLATAAAFALVLSSSVVWGIIDSRLIVLQTSLALLSSSAFSLAAVSFERRRADLSRRWLDVLERSFTGVTEQLENSHHPARVVASDALSTDQERRGSEAKLQRPYDPQEHSGDESLFARNALMDRVAGNVEVFREVVARFLADAPQLIGAVRLAVEGGDEAANELKEHSSMETEDILAVAAAESEATRTENPARIGDLAAVTAAWERLRRQVESLSTELATLESAASS
jgi:hypothetical protein